MHAIAIMLALYMPPAVHAPEPTITHPVTVIVGDAPTRPNVGNLVQCGAWTESAVGGSYRSCKVSK